MIERIKCLTQSLAHHESAANGTQFLLLLVITRTWEKVQITQGAGTLALSSTLRCSSAEALCPLYPCSDPLLVPFLASRSLHLEEALGCLLPFFQDPVMTTRSCSDAQCQNRSQPGLPHSPLSSCKAAACSTRLQSLPPTTRE